MAHDLGKKSEPLRIWVSEPLELELRRLADRDDRKLSDYVELILRRHVFGHLGRLTDTTEGTKRSE